ncbi:MAG: restriction endonuclease subunit S, partial [Microbacterium sp.]|uniref:restriction endonuclease subunit S n=1 Tax=Microbacterium sp. TaxID=51671 RepID=UPI002816D8DF
MFQGLRRYDQYAAISSPWVQELPKHWRAERVKSLLSERVEKGYPDEPLLAATQSQGVIKKSDYGTRTVTATKDLHLLKLVEVGDFVISLRSFQGGIERCYHRGIISPAYTVLIARSAANRDYLTYLFKSKPFVSSLTLAVTGIREGQSIDYSTLAVDRLPVPPIEEQAAIVKYLAHANDRIDKAISAKHHLIKLLEEKRAVEAQNVFVSGAIDNVPMLPLKRLVDIRGGMTPSKENLAFWGGDIPWVSPKDVKTDVLSNSIDHLTHAALDQTSISLVPSGAVVIVVRGMILARTIPVATLGVNAALNQDMKALIPRAGMLGSEYLRDWFRAYEAEVLQLVETAGHGTKKLDTDVLMKLRVPVPSIAEQRRISARIAQDGATTGAAVKRVRDEIKLLNEFRTRLVADVVTGQVDVRGIAAELPGAPALFERADTVLDDDLEEV